MSNSTDSSGFSDRTSSGRRAVDWILTGMLVLLGFALMAVGGLLQRIADRDAIADLVAEETIESDLFTETELVDFLFAGSWWGGLGIILAGGTIVIIGLAFGIGRRRIDRAGADADPPTLRANALLGAFVTVITSFVPFSSILGGGVAGYLQTEDSWSGALTGAFAGILLALPFVIIAAMVMFGLALEGLPIFVLMGVIGLLFTLAFTVGLSAIGGAVGAYIRRNY